MYIHIGGDAMVNTADIIGIFDVNIQQSQSTKQFLQSFRERGNFEVLDNSETKSFVVTIQKIFFSPISSTTLKKRALVFANEPHDKHDVEGCK